MESLLNSTKEEIDYVIRNLSNYYYSYPIKKKSGKLRKLDVPVGILKHWQKIILKEILYKYKPSEIAHGFVRRRGPKTAAQEHAGQRVILSIDIKDFFNSIEPALLYRSMASHMMWRHRRRELETIIKLITLNKGLPQGAPTSPAASNIAMMYLDSRLKMFADQNNYIVSRYADDITISSNDPAEFNIRTILAILKSNLKLYNLKINYDKIHVNYYYNRMQVLGVVINEKTNVAKWKRKILRAKIHNLVISQEPINVKDAQKIRGEIEWVRYLNPKNSEKLLKDFGKINVQNI